MNHHYEQGEAKKIKRNWRRILSVKPDRTIRIVPRKISGQTIHNEGYETYAYDFFQQFGKVESTNKRYTWSTDKDDLKYILIQFEDAKVADDLLKTPHILINNMEFEVTPLKRIRKPEDESCTDESKAERMESLKEVNVEPSIVFQVPTEESPENILNALNEHCLRTVFEKVDHPSDFLSIANVCTYFNQIAKDVFAVKIRRRRVSLDKLSFKCETLTLSRIEDFLRVFGLSVVSLRLYEYSLRKVNIPDVPNTFLKMINEHCKNLEKLDLMISDVSADTLVEIQPLLSQLKCLQIYLPDDVNVGQIMDFVFSCTQLETLQIEGWTEEEITLPAIKLPNLINFSMNDVSLISIDTFLLANPQIETLQTKLAPHLCRLIANKMPNIRKLTLENEDDLFSETDSIYLKHLEHLEVEMTTNFRDSITNIFPVKNITTLSITVFDFFNEILLIELTQRLSNLNELNIFFEDHHKMSTLLLKRMLQNAKQLTLLRLGLAMDCLHHFDDTDYYAILEVVKNRANHEKLIIEIKCETHLFRSAEGYQGHKTKLIRLDMEPKWLTVLLEYEQSR